MAASRTIDRPLIAGRARGPVLAVIAVGALVLVVLAVVVWHGTTTRFDTWAFRRAYLDFPPPGSVGRRFWLWFSEPVVSLAVPVVIAVWSMAIKRWNVLALAVLGPSLALVLAELVGKPLVGRVIGPGVLLDSTAGALTGSYPSGHETALVSWLVLLLVVLFRVPATRASTVRILAVILAFGWAFAGAVGLTVNYYHYATDTIGAVGLATATVLTVALVIDRWMPAVG